LNRKVPIAGALVALAISANVGCSSHYSTVREGASGPVTLYRVSRAEALQFAHNALSVMFPGRKITEIQGPPSGYSTSYRMMLDTYSQQVVAVPATGIDPSGLEVRGYYFEVSGSGTAVISGRVKNSELFDRVKELAERSGRPTRVTAWRIDYRSEDVSQPPRPPVPENRSPAAARLRELEQLRRDGLISEDEYRTKRAKILDEM
jgi:hypothetical protein